MQSNAAIRFQSAMPFAMGGKSRVLTAKTHSTSRPCLCDAFV